VKRMNLTARMGLALLVASVLGVPLAGAQSAWAVRYASPSGKTTNDCKTPATACDIGTAIHGTPGNEPALGEEVVLAAGEYTAAEIQPGASDLTVRGSTGGPRPVIKATETEAFNGSYLNLAYLTIEHTGGGYGLDIFDGRIERVLLRGLQSQNPICQCYGSELLDSIAVVLPGSTGAAVGIQSNGGTASEKLRNDTIYSLSATAPALELEQQSSTQGSVSLEALNTIAVNTAGGPGVKTSARTGITFGDSDYAGPVGGGSISNIGGNISAPPRLVDVAGGDFHELPSSPTIDAGVSSPADGALDFDGNARSAGRSTDIGALEYQPPAAAPASPSGSTPPPTGSGKPAPAPVALAAMLRSTLVLIDARHGTGRLTVTCKAPAGQSCAIAGTLYVPGKHSRSRAHKAAKQQEMAVFAGTLAAGTTGSLRVKLTRAGIAALRRAGSYVVFQAASVRDHGADVGLTGARRLRVEEVRGRRR
jgi:hypothetical protein